MANILVTPSVIADEALMQLENLTVMGNLVHRQYKKEFVKKGDTVSIRKPVRFEAKEGADITYNVQDVTESTIDFKIDQRWNTAWPFGAEELTLTIEQYSERYIKPGMIPLANKIDETLCALYADVFNAAGVAGTTPNTFMSLASVSQKLDEGAVPAPDRRLVLNPAANWSMANALKGLFNAQMVTDFVRSGMLANIAGLEIYRDQNIKTHTAATTLAATGIVNGASQTGTSLVTDGWTISSETLKAGDVFTVASVYAVNPVSKQSTGQLQQFTATAAATSDGSGDCTIAISPEIVTSGAHQNVSASPGDGAVITLTGSHTANLAFHKNAFGLVTVPIAIPQSAAWGERKTANGYSVRVVKGYDVLTDVETIRLDILFGVKTLYPELACRLLG